MLEKIQDDDNSLQEQIENLKKLARQKAQELTNHGQDDEEE